MFRHELAAPSITITSTEFKATCLHVFRELERRHISGVVVTRRGKPIARLSPPEVAPVDPWGLLRGQAVVTKGVDLTAPILDEPLDARQGRLHR